MECAHLCDREISFPLCASMQTCSQVCSGCLPLCVYVCVCSCAHLRPPPHKLIIPCNLRGGLSSCIFSSWPPTRARPPSGVRLSRRGASRAPNPRRAARRPPRGGGPGRRRAVRAAVPARRVPEPDPADEPPRGGGRWRWGRRYALAGGGRGGGVSPEWSSMC